MMRQALRVGVQAARVVVGLLFLVSGLIKVNDLTGFVYKLEEYFHVFARVLTPGFDALLPFATAIAAFITLLEVALAFLLLLGLWRGLTVWLLIVLIFFFTLLTGYSALTGAVTDCGCFGEVLKLTPLQSFLKDVVLLGLILFLYLYREEIVPLFSSQGIRVGIFFILMVVSAALTYQAYHHLPFVDFTAYAEGQNLQVNTTTRNADGQIIAKDYASWGEACDSTSELQGTTLLVVLYDAQDTAAVRQSGALARALAAQGIRVFGGTSLTRSARAQLQQALDLPYCLAPQDATMLKTMIRSSPGYLLLRDGVVIRKWHQNDAPDAATVVAAAQ